MAQNLIRLKQLNTTELSGFFASTITNTGVFVDSLNSLPYQFPSSTGIRRYVPLDLFSTTSVAISSGAINYFPFIVKKKTTDPVACVEMTVYSTFNPKVAIGIYDGSNGFENANLIASGSITGDSLNIGIYRTKLNGTFNQGPYIIGSILESGAGSSFRTLSSHGFREHFGINTGSSTLFGGVSNTFLTNVLAQTGAAVLPDKIGSGVWYGSATNVLSPIVFLEY